MPRANPTAEWVFGLLAGALTGFALAMIFVEPNWITPDSPARRYITIGGLAGAAAVIVIRNWMAGRGSPAAGPAPPDGGFRE